MKYISKEIFDFLVYDPKEELKKRGLHICGEPADKVDIQMAFTCGVRFVLDLVDKTKPADVAPVVHAHWKPSILPLLQIDWFRCSNCNANAIQIPFDIPARTEFCPFCGAKMDEEVD